MKTIETKVYSFNELSKEAQQTAIDNNRNVNVEYENWWEDVYYEQKNYIASFGFDDIEINFSGFYSQGDGASFTGFVNPVKWIKENDVNKKYRRIVNFFNEQIDYSGEITRQGHYYHEKSISYYMNADIHNCNQNNDFKNIYGLLSDLEADIQGHIIDLSKEIYNNLEIEYEYLTSDEGIKKEIIANEYEFTEDGTQF